MLTYGIAGHGLGTGSFHRPFSRGSLHMATLDVGRALSSCRLLRGAWHRDIAKPWFASIAVSSHPFIILVTPSPFCLDHCRKAPHSWKVSFQPWKKSSLCFQHYRQGAGAWLLRWGWGVYTRRRYCRIFVKILTSQTLNPIQKAASSNM